MTEVSLKEIDSYPVGTIFIPPSKSIGHRAVICAALAGAQGEDFGLKNLDVSEDIIATSRAMNQLLNGDNLDDIDCGESGSTLRFLIPIAAMSGKECNFVGRGRLMERPLDIYEDIFNKQKLLFKKTDKGITIKGPLASGTYTMPGNISSQFITGMMFALSLCEHDSEIILSTYLESRDYVELTIDTMRSFGVDVKKVTCKRKNQ